jgi:hypothetical protein
MSSSAGPSIITNSLILHLDAADRKSYPGSGTVWSDRSGNGINGTLTNGPTFSSGNAGSILFNGIDHWATLPSTPKFAFGTNPYTINIWYKLSTIANYSCLFSLGGSNGPYGGLYVNRFSSNSLLFYANAIRLQPTIEQLQNVWYNITFIGNNSSIYLNSVKLQESAYSANFIQQGFIIGANHSAYSEVMRGNISVVQIYNRALSDAEIKQNFNATKSRFGLL